MSEGVFPKVDGDVLYASEVNNFNNGIVPIGAVVAWLKSYTNTPTLPDGFIECNGQTLSDADSVYNGQIIPDLNGGNRFLRGSSTSGTTGGSDTHDHTDWVGGGNVSSTGSGGSKMTASNLPKYYEVVWIMRVK